MSARMGGGAILWYVHHQGAGHWRRALAVTRRLSRDVVLMSSAGPPGPLPPRARFVRLPADFPPELPADPGSASARAEAGGVLHWAPPHHRGLLRRHAAILAEVDRSHPALAVVDVSVEVAVLLRSSGVPLIAVRLPGRRTDPPHQLGFALADEVLMPVPAHWAMQSGLARTAAVGLVSALSPSAGPGFDGRGGLGSSGAGTGDGPVVIVIGRGGTRIDPATCARIAAEVPGRPVRVLGLPAPVAGRARRPEPDNLVFAGRVPDPGGELAAAGVVVANCGLGTLADVVTARRPLVVLPEDRPFGEQRATAAALAAHGEAVVLDDLPGRGGWRAAVEAARALGPPRLIADGAKRFAERVERRAAAEDNHRGSNRGRRQEAGAQVSVETRQHPATIRLAPSDGVMVGPDRRSEHRTDRRAERRAGQRADRRVRQ